MRAMVLGTELLVVPEYWTAWQTALLRFQRRADQSIWCQSRHVPGPWRCVSPCLMPSRQKGAA